MKLSTSLQAAALCGVHCVNSLLQGPFFTEWDMAKMAQDLDELERRLMASQGVNTPEFIKYAAEESGNVAGDGMFSIQVRYFLTMSSSVKLITRVTLYLFQKGFVTKRELCRFFKRLCQTGTWPPAQSLTPQCRR